MAYLADLGFLEQPHTSAGRIPSDAGFRYYVDNLMPHLSPSNADMFKIMSGIDHTQGEASRLLSEACTVLSELTGMFAVATTPYAADAVINSVQAVPIGEKNAMVVITTTAGVLKSRVAKLPEEADFSLYELFYNVVASNFLNTPAFSVTKAKLQTVAASLGARSFEIMPLLICLYDAITESADAEVITKGHNLLYAQPGLKDTASAVMSLSEDTDAFVRLLTSERKGPTDIKIGSENGYSFMRGASVVTSAYRAGENEAGVIGIIGASSMDYSHIVPLVEYMSGSISSLITDNNNS